MLLRVNDEIPKAICLENISHSRQRKNVLFSSDLDVMGMSFWPRFTGFGQKK